MNEALIFSFTLIKVLEIIFFKKMACPVPPDQAKRELEQSKKKNEEEQKKELCYSMCYTDSGSLTRRRCNRISAITMNILKGLHGLPSL